MGLVLKDFPKPSQEAHTRGTKRALAQIRPYGITSFIDMATNEETLATYQMLEREGKLNFRIDACIQMSDYTKEWESDPEALLKKRKQYQSRLIDPNHVKYWADGTPFSYTSLLVEPCLSDDELLNLNRRCRWRDRGNLVAETGEQGIGRDLADQSSPMAGPWSDRASGCIEQTEKEQSVLAGRLLQFDLDILTGGGL